MDKLWCCGKKVGIAGAVMISLPVVLPIGLFLSIVGATLAVPVGSAVVGYTLLKRTFASNGDKQTSICGPPAFLYEHREPAVGNSGGVQSCMEDQQHVNEDHVCNVNADNDGYEHGNLNVNESYIFNMKADCDIQSGLIIQDDVKSDGDIQDLEAVKAGDDNINRKVVRGEETSGTDMEHVNINVNADTDNMPMEAPEKDPGRSEDAKSLEYSDGTLEYGADSVPEMRWEGHNGLIRWTCIEEDRSMCSGSQCKLTPNIQELLEANEMETVNEGTKDSFIKDSLTSSQQEPGCAVEEYAHDDTSFDAECATEKFSETSQDGGNILLAIPEDMPDLVDVPGKHEDAEEYTDVGADSAPEKCWDRPTDFSTCMEVNRCLCPGSQCKATPDIHELLETNEIKITDDASSPSSQQKLECDVEEYVKDNASFGTDYSPEKTQVKFSVPVRLEDAEEEIPSSCQCKAALDYNELIEAEQMLQGDEYTSLVEDDQYVEGEEEEIELAEEDAIEDSGEEDAEKIDELADVTKDLFSARLEMEADTAEQIEEEISRGASKVEDNSLSSSEQENEDKQAKDIKGGQPEQTEVEQVEVCISADEDDQSSHQSDEHNTGGLTWEPKREEMKPLSSWISV